MPKTSKPSPAAKRGSGKRELLANAAGDFFARRSGDGRFSEMDERGRSLATDRRRKATTVSTPGRGDTGDRKRK
jgi:hypothetical protein